mgnify:FL=1
MSDLGENTVLQAEDLIGMTPRRIAYADRPLLRHDLQRPQLVSRGDNVTIVYDYGPMKLSAKGKALESGSKEDNIRVVNVASNRTIDAFVIDSGVVTVTP